jgi:hypothetical protein
MGFWNRTRTLLCVLTVASAPLHACSKAEAPTDPRVEPPLPDGYPQNRGHAVPTPNISGSISLEWASPTELLYHSVALTPLVEEIRAVNISSFDTRVLHRGGNSGGYRGYGAVVASPDGQRVFATLNKPLTIEHDLIHIGDALSSALIRVNPLTGSGDVMLPTPDSKSVAYGVGVDSMNLYDVNTRTSRRIGEGCNTPAAFAPDGGTLFCRRGSDYLMMNVATGVTTPPIRYGLVLAPFWGAAEVELLLTDLDKLTLLNVTAGSSKVLLADFQLRSFELPDYIGARRSRDGRKVAVTSRRSTTFLGPTAESVLYVIDTETLAIDRVAVVITGSDTWIQRMAFSPDGKNIAYVVGNPYGGSVYVSAIP